AVRCRTVVSVFCYRQPSSHESGIITPSSRAHSSQKGWRHGFLSSTTTSSGNCRRQTPAHGKRRPTGTFGVPVGAGHSAKLRGAGAKCAFHRGYDTGSTLGGLGPSKVFATRTHVSGQCEARFGQAQPRAFISLNAPRSFAVCGVFALVACRTPSTRRYKKYGGRLQQH